jgi:hypothetical protein
MIYKIIRSVTVPQSIGFFEEVMMRLKEDGYEVVVVTSPGKVLDDFKQRHPKEKTIEVPMERRISLTKDIKSLWQMIKVMRKEKPYIVHSMTPKAGLLTMIAGWLTGVPVRVHTFTGLVWPTETGLKRKILMATDWLTEHQRSMYAYSTTNIGYGLGMRAPRKDAVHKEFGWAGAAGAYASIDPELNVSFYYAQHVIAPPNRHLRPWIYNAVRADLLGETIEIPYRSTDLNPELTY